MTNSERRLAVENERKQIYFKRKAYVMKNLSEVRKKSQSVVEKKNSDQSIKAEITKRNPGDPIINTRRPF